MEKPHSPPIFNKLPFLLSAPFYLLSFSFCLFSIPSNAQQYGWSDISGNLPGFPYDTTIINGGADTIYAHISDISFIDDNEGWVTTWHPYNDQSAAILHTTDGGMTWEVQTVMRPCQVIHMVDENMGYAGSDGGLIFKTTDGGQNWNYFGISGGPITGMSFPAGSDTGYLCSYMSSNLQQITSEAVNPINLGNTGWWNSISAPSHNLIWIGEGSSVWTIDEDGLTDQPITSAHYNSIFFTRNDLGWGVGYEGVKSQNLGVIAGCNGKNMGWVHLKYTERPLSIIFALDDNHVWAAGFDGYIYYSENASQFGRDTTNGSWWSNVTFVSQPNPRPDLDFLSLFFTSPQNGFASAGSNTLLKYTQISGISEKTDALFEISPNPAKEKCKVQSPKCKLEDCTVEILDLYGRNVMNVFKGKFPAEGIEFDVSHLPSGIYFCRIRTADSYTIKKILKL